MFKPFLMSQHCFCDVVTLDVDVVLLLRLCFDVTTLSYSSVVMRDVVANVATLLFAFLF